MNVLVINGSPKGKSSITYQTIRFLQKKFPRDEFEVIHAGAYIVQLEDDMSGVCELVEKADILLFAYPVYTFIAPSQLHRFIALLKEQDVDLEGKYATQITTSKHFYDVTAHRFIEDNCRDMGMKVLRGFSEDRNDLLTKMGQLQIITYWNYVKHIIEKETAIFEEERVKTSIKDKNKKYHVVIVTDCKKENERLRQLIIDFRKALPYASHVVNLQDGFDVLLHNKIQRADSIVYAFSIKDHSMGALFKTYDDRQFCNSYRSVTMGKPTAYIIDGELSQEENLKLIIEGRSQVGGNFLAGIATNEGVGADSPESCADKLAYALEHRIKLNENFYGVGGRRILRDMKVVTILFMKFVRLLMQLPQTKFKVEDKITDVILAPYERIITGKSINE